jgi:methylamine dehydrogenase accessory protein MauD
MDVALLVARVLLVMVFSVAGVTKLADRTGSKQALVDFGLPASLAAPLAVLLPLAELGVAAALIPASTAWWGAVGALVLLLLFVVGIGANLARGRKPECHCFGQLHSEPAGWKTLARNGVLATVAGFVVWLGYGGVGPSAVGWLAGFSTAQLLGLGFGVVLLGMVAAQWWFLLGLLRQNGRLAMRVEALEGGRQEEPPAGLPLGDAAPEFELPNLQGRKLTLEALRAPGKPVILLFTDPNCGPCKAMLPDVGRWQEEYAGKLTVALVSRGEPEENAISASEHGLANVLLQEDWEVADDYRVDGTPSAVLVQPDGTIASPVLEGAKEVREFLARTIEEPAQLRP